MDAIQRAGMGNLGEDGLHHVLCGETTIEEVLRVAAAEPGPVATRRPAGES